MRFRREVSKNWLRLFDEEYGKPLDRYAKHLAEKQIDRQERAKFWDKALPR